MIRRKKKGQRRGTIRAWLIGAILSLLAACLCVYLYVDSGGKLDVVRELSYGSELQNNKVASSRALGYTFLGTYKDAVLAVDAQGNEAWRYTTSGSVEGIEYDASRELVIVGAQGRYVYVLNAADGGEVRAIQVAGRIFDIDYHEATGRILIAGQKNAAKGMLAVYDLEGNELLSLSTRPTRGCVFSPDGASIYYGDSRATVYLLDNAGEEMGSALLDKEIYALDMSDGTGDLVVVSDGGTVVRFDAALNEHFRVRLTGDGRAVAITADGGLVGMGTREGDVYLLNEQGEVQYSTRLADAVSQIVIDDDASFIVPWSAKLYSLDVSSASEFARETIIHAQSFRLMFALTALALLMFALAFGGSRAKFFAFFRSLAAHRTAYLLLLPSFALIVLFSYVPIGEAFYYAFTDWNMASTTMRDVKFVGIDNFAKMISEGYFLLGVKNMLIIMLFSFLKLLMPLLIAELVFVNSSDRRKYWFRFFLVLPMVVPGVVSTLMWKQIYDPATGLINKFFELIGRADLQRSWLGSEATALGSIIFMGFPWVNSFAFLVFYGGLINIPHDLFEAARVDGSTPAWNLTRIHLPLILPQIKMIVILTFISAIQDYGSVLLLTDGGPGYATYVPGFELYMNATRLGQYGYACALGLVMFVVILAGTILNMKIRTEESLNG